MDWFQRLAGFVETTGRSGYDRTRERLELNGRHLRSRVNGRRYGIGQLELAPLETLRTRAKTGDAVAGRRKLVIVQGDVRPLHLRPEYRGALFQVASQFNLLEMVDESITPEHGVTGYQHDRTQGPACAIAAGAATIYRNYFARVGSQVGQTSGCQLDGFADLGAAVALALGRPASALWTMRNGYTMFLGDGVDAMSQHVASLDEAARDGLRQLLRIGLHWDVEVTDAEAFPGPEVSQAFCSALPISYNRRAGAHTINWAPLACLVLEAAYEATLWAAVINAQRGASRTVLQTMLGGGAFGNDDAWIQAAIERAITQVDGHGLDIVIVSYTAPSAELQRWAGSLN